MIEVLANNGQDTMEAPSGLVQNQEEKAVDTQSEYDVCKDTALRSTLALHELIHHVNSKYHYSVYNKACTQSSALS